MAQLNAIIDASGSARGAQEFRGAAEQVGRSAEQAGRGVDALERELREVRAELGNQRNAVGAYQQENERLGRSAVSNATRLRASRQEIDALRRELAQQRGELASGRQAFDRYAQAALRNAQRLRQARGEIRQLRSQIDGLSVSGARSIPILDRLGAALSIGLVIGGSVRALRSFEQTLAEVGAVSGATASEFDLLRSAARDAGSTTQFTATQAGESLLFLSRAGFSVGESISALPATLDIATAGALDLGTAADISSNALSQFGLQAANLDRVGDIIVGAANRSNTSVEQLGEALSNTGTIANALGVPISEVSAAIGVLGNSGIQGSRAGTVLNNIFRGLSVESPKLSRALDSLGLRFADVNVQSVGLTGALEAINDAGGLTAQAAVEIAGRWGQAGLLALAGATDQLQALNSELENNAGESARVADAVRDNLNGSFQQAISAAEGLVLSLGEAGVSQALEGVLAGFTGAARGGIAFFEALSEDEALARTTTFAVTGLGVALGTAGLARAATVAATAVRGLTVALAANPITLAASAVLGLAAAVVTLARDTSEATEEVRKLSGEVQGLEAVAARLDRTQATIDVALERGDFDRAARGVLTQIENIRTAAETVRRDDSISFDDLIALGELGGVSNALDAALSDVRSNVLRDFREVAVSAAQAGDQAGIAFVRGLAEQLGDLDGQLGLESLDRLEDRLSEALAIQAPFQQIADTTGPRARALQAVEQLFAAFRGEVDLTEDRVDRFVADLGPGLENTFTLSKLDTDAVLLDVQLIADELRRAQDSIAAGEAPEVDLVRVNSNVLSAQLQQAEQLLRDQLAEIESQAEGVSFEPVNFSSLFGQDLERLAAGVIDQFATFGERAAEALRRGISAAGEVQDGQRNSIQELLGDLEFEANLAGATAAEVESLAVARELAARGAALESSELAAYLARAEAALGVRRALEDATNGQAFASGFLARQQAELVDLEQQLALARAGSAEERAIIAQRFAQEAATQRLLAEAERLRIDNAALLSAELGSLTLSQAEAREEILASIDALTLQAGAAGENAFEIARLRGELEALDNSGESRGLENFRISAQRTSGTILELIQNAENAQDILEGFLFGILNQIAQAGIATGLEQALPGVFGSAKGNVFSGGIGTASASIVPFQFGGVVNSPVTFPLDGGDIGLAGEAGPEAILPLRRRNGVLGVEATVERPESDAQNLARALAAQDNVIDLIDGLRQEFDSGRVREAQNLADRTGDAASRFASELDSERFESTQAASDRLLDVSEDLGRAFQDGRLEGLGEQADRLSRASTDAQRNLESTQLQRSLQVNEELAGRLSRNESDFGDLLFRNSTATARQTRELGDEARAREEDSSRAVRELTALLQRITSDQFRGPVSPVILDTRDARTRANEGGRGRRQTRAQVNRAIRTSSRRTR